MDTRGKVNYLTGSILKLYKAHLGKLDVSLTPICFCIHDSCGSTHDGPLTEPIVSSNSVRIHLHTSIDGNYYPAQIAYQYAHELWHAYEFSWRGIDHDYTSSNEYYERYAHAACLCILNDFTMPKEYLDNESYRSYVNKAKGNFDIRDVYQPGVDLARSVDYDIKSLFKIYDKDYENRNTSSSS